MEVFEKSLKVMNELFARDYQFALATSNNNMPSVRFVDTFFYNGCFYIVTYAKSKKVKELEINKNVSLCNKLYNFQGVAYNLGHPLKPQNSEIRKKLIRAFERKRKKIDAWQPILIVDTINPVEFRFSNISTGLNFYLLFDFSLNF